MPIKGDISWEIMRQQFHISIALVELIARQAWERDEADHTVNEDAG